MNPARFARLKEIVLAASQLPAAERDAYLDAACEKDEALRRKANSLLARGDDEPAILASGVAARARVEATAAPAASDTDAAGAAPAPRRFPDRIGPYELIDILGDGGMGVVYRARQTSPIRREVAIKLLRGGAGSTRVLERFEAEKQTLARMQHSSIATVIDAGSLDDGTPYFVMELVLGSPVTAYGTARGLDVPSRIRLFTAVCRAVQHAHQKGVIHRDLKPSNILVTESEGRPVPKVIDFGIAKAIDDAGAGASRTVDGQILGTPEYMSPEQARGLSDSIDTRSDVYSLGVVLYEMLAGRLPYAAQRESARTTPIIETLRAIREDTPRPLRAGWPGKGVPPADLETILAKALEKDPERRYASAGELADDLERFLASQPIHARPASTAYQMSKLIARHRMPVMFATLFLVAIIGFGVTMSALYGKASRAERSRAVEAETARRTTDFLIGLFNVTTPSQSLGRVVSAREIVDSAAANVDDELRDEPAVQATLMRTLGIVYASLGYYEPAVEMMEKALERQRESSGDRNLDVAATETKLGWIYYGQARYDEAEALLRNAIATRSALLGAEHQDIGEPMDFLAQVLYARGEFQSCVDAFAAALAIKEKALGPDHKDLATTLANYGAVLSDAGRYDEAEALLSRARTIYERDYGREHFHSAATATQIGYLHWNQGNLARAEEEIARALPIFERAMGADHPDVANCHKDLGGILASLGRYAESRAHLEAALRINEARLGGDHADLAPILSWLGLIAIQGEGDASKAEALQRRAIDATVRSSGEDAAILSSRYVNLGWVLETQGRFDEADSALSRALVLARDGYGPEHYKTGRCLNYLGYLAYERGDLARAESLYAASFAVYDQVADRFTQVHMLRELAAVRGARRDARGAADAESLLTVVRETCEREGWTAPPIYAATLADLAAATPRSGAFRRIVLP
ncbi:MAG: tetratricopeptide repeat protein [bacterium]